MILNNHLVDLNETYTHYKGGYVELTYQFSRDSKFSQKHGKFKVLKAIDVFHGIVGMWINWNYFSISLISG